MESGLNKVLLPYQRRWLEDNSQLKIWLASRQIGKSFSIAMEAVIESLKAKCTNLILSSSERQSNEVMKKVLSHLRVLRVISEDSIFPERETKEEIALPNGSRIISLPANPDTVRGFSGNIFLDEFAFHKDSKDIWRAIYPTITRGYKLRITSTPGGKDNMFYEIWHYGERFSKHRTDIYSAIKEGLRVDIEQLRAGCIDAESWAQEFECRFIDEASAFITYEMLTSCEDDSAGTDTFSINPSGEYYLGVDIGRRHDLSVFWLWEKVSDVFWTRLVREMKGSTFREQREFLYSLLEGSPSIRRTCIDATGIGAQLAEEAVERFGNRVEPVVFTPRVKEDLAFTFRRKFEDRLVRIPRDRAIREDLHSVRKLTTSSGNIRFDSERTEAGHSDRFWAGALGLHAGEAQRTNISYEVICQRRYKDYRFSLLEI